MRSPRHLFYEEFIAIILLLFCYLGQKSHVLDCVWVRSLLRHKWQCSKFDIHRHLWKTPKRVFHKIPVNGQIWVIYEQDDGLICWGVWNLPRKYHLYLFLKLYSKYNTEIASLPLLQTSKISLNFWTEIQIHFVDLKSNLALLYNKGHNFWKSLLTWKIPQNWL